jgi:hypothetical protein
MDLPNCDTLKDIDLPKTTNEDKLKYALVYNSIIILVTKEQLLYLKMKT